MTDWELPPIASAAALADVLELDEGQLLWLADLRGLERRAPSEQLRNYRYRLIARRGGGLPRLLEIPKGRTKEIQRWILRSILDRVPVHEAACGFRPGGSVRLHASRHCGAPMVLSLDLADFFPTVRRARVARVFSGLGYRREVAVLLAGLCTNVVPVEVWAEMERVGGFRPDLGPVGALRQASLGGRGSRAAGGSVPESGVAAGESGVAAGERGDGRRYRLDRLLASPHLPQGAPTSPALANLACFGLDRRLSGLAARAGLAYSRYADDLTFSGSLSRRSRVIFAEMVSAIVVDEGFVVRAEKTRVHSRGERQRVCGVVVNAVPNVPRDDYDALRAMLHNCVVHGPAGQNRAGVPDFRAHLRGRIAWVADVHPARGARLLTEFNRIEWPSE